MRIRIDDLTDPRVGSLLREHLDDMHTITPPESVHALDIEGLRSSEITFWTAWEGERLLGCGGLKELVDFSGEIKSMRTAENHRGKGVASGILDRILIEAQHRFYRSLHLETGSMAEFAPARALYKRYGFEESGPFGSYLEDPNSVFMTKFL